MIHAPTVATTRRALARARSRYLENIERIPTPLLSIDEEAAREFAGLIHAEQIRRAHVASEASWSEYRKKTTAANAAPPEVKP